MPLTDYSADSGTAVVDSPTAPGRTVKYWGPNGETWSGRGKRPKWLEMQLANGKALEDFAHAPTTCSGADDANVVEAWPFPIAATDPKPLAPKLCVGQRVAIVNDTGADGMLRAKHYPFADAAGTIVAEAGREWTVRIEVLRDGKKPRASMCRRNFEPIELEVVAS